MSRSNAFTFIDLFSGIGGFRLALDNLGGTCLNFSEISKDAVHSYCTNFKEQEHYNLGDITKVKKLPKHDLLTAGVPCQSWSIAGKNLGFDDDRGQLWNDTIFLLNNSKPKAFIFENVKGLVDPRNKEALNYILERIRMAGYFADYYVLNSFDYGVPQNRIWIYIVGFLEERFHKKLKLPQPIQKKIRLSDILENVNYQEDFNRSALAPSKPVDETMPARSMSLSNNKGFNDYFLFNDLRNGHTTIHSWDIIKTTHFQKNICYLLLKNRRKSAYGDFDGNPLSLAHFQSLDSAIRQRDLNDLVRLNILKEEEYRFKIITNLEEKLTIEELSILECTEGDTLNIDKLKNNKNLKITRLNILKTIESLKEKGVIVCTELRYDFKNTKISTGLFGISRIFLPSSNIFPTLVASGTNDFIATEDINAENADDYKTLFLQQIYQKKKFRKISKEEACQVQGFPTDFPLPANRARWMKLIGNSVTVPVIQMLGSAIIKTGVFNKTQEEQSFTKVFETVAT